MTADERALLAQNRDATAAIAARLRQSIDRLTPLFPLTPARLAAADPGMVEAIDAFILRFSTLASSIQDRLFKSIAIAEGEDVSRASNRDKADLMEKLGALPSATSFSRVIDLRNRLAHDYPNDPDRRARRLNEVWAAAPDLLAASEAILAYAARSRPGGDDGEAR